MKINKIRVLPYDEHNLKLEVEAIFEKTDPDLELDYYQRSIRNNKWLVKELVEFRRWDQCFDYGLLHRLFREKARYFMEQGHLARSYKTGLKILEISNRFEKLATDTTIPAHLVWNYNDRKRREVVLGENGLTYNFLVKNRMGMNEDEYCTKMMRLGAARERRLEKAYLEDTMKLLAKHWPTFWD